LTLLLAGCSAKHYRASADKEVYGAITAKGSQVVNMDEQFTIEQTNGFALEGLPVRSDAEPFLGIATEAERGAAVLSLEKALAVAVNQSRLYQNNKEQLLSALLHPRATSSRPFSGGGRVSYAVETEKSCATRSTRSLANLPGHQR
jgi:hypothetical protein